jgi:hypothetical protein
MMTTEPITESGLTFGSFPEGHCFYIEKSQAYQNIGSAVKMVEFLLLRPHATANKTAIWMIEAKKTAPNPNSQGKLEERMNEVKEKLNSNLDYSDAQIEDICVNLTPHPFDVYIEEICDKFVNALTLFVSIYLDRYSSKCDELSDNFNQINLANIRFVFVLVIKNSKEEWVKNVQEALNKKLRPKITTWNLAAINIHVFNEEMARRKQLIHLGLTQN